MIRNENTNTTIEIHEVKSIIQEQIDMLAAGFLPLILEYYQKGGINTVVTVGCHNGS